MSRHFSDSALSRILSLHAVGGLARGGSEDGYLGWNQTPFSRDREDEDAPCCMVEAAENAGSLDSYPDRDTAWFDTVYNPGWSADEFAQRLAAREWLDGYATEDGRWQRDEVIAERRRARAK